MIKHALIMLVYAATMLFLGVLAFLVAPPDASKATALAIPGVAALLILAAAVMSLLKGRPRTIGVWAGIVLSGLFAVAFAARAIPMTAAYFDAHSALVNAPADERATAAEVDDARGGPRVEALRKDYLIMTLWGVTSLSVLSLVSLMLFGPPRRVRRADPGPDSRLSQK